MAGIVIPEDRTTKQPVIGRCYNPACKERSDAEGFEFQTEHDLFACPKCGANKQPVVFLLVLTHLLIPDQANGPIVGQGGLQYRLGCDSKRAYLATVTNQEAASGDKSVVNCPGCLAEASKLRVPAVAGHAIYAKKE